MRKNLYLLSIGFLLLSDVSGQEIVDTTLPSLIPYRKGNLFGFYNKEKKPVIPAKYAWVRPFNKNRAIVAFDIEEHGRYGVIDSTGKELFTIGKDTTITILNDGTITAEKGFFNIIFAINAKEEIFRLRKYQVKWQFDENLYVAKRGKRFGVINQFEKIIIPFKYKHIWQLDEKGYALAVKRNGQSGFIDKNGKTVFPFFKKGITLGPFSGERAVIGIGEKFKQLYGLIDSSGTIVRPIQYTAIYHYEKDLFVASGENKWGVIRINGDTVIPFRYNDIRWLGKERYEFKDSTMFGIMDAVGKEFFRKKNRDTVLISYISDAFIVYSIMVGIGVSASPRYGAIDINGKEVLPPVYISLWYNGPGVISVTDKDIGTYYMDFRFNKYYED